MKDAGMHVENTCVNELIRELPKGFIKWYEFHKGMKALFVMSDDSLCEVLTEAMAECGLQVECMELNNLESGENKNARELYEYIVVVGALERSQSPVNLLHRLRGMLSDEGRLLLGTDNRLGIRYFCGDQDAFTRRVFDGIENYAKVGMADRKKMKGRAYARAEIVQMLESAGITQYRFYSVMPGLSRPQAIYAEDYMPEEELDVRIVPQYNSPDTVFLQEEGLYTTLIQNGLFHIMANGFFIECSMNGVFSNIKQVTISMDRGVENGLMTLIRRDNKVEKRPLYAEGYHKIEQLMEYTADLRKHEIKMIDARLENGSFVMPYMQGEPVTDYFRRLLCENRELFLQEMDRFWELIKGSSEHVPYEKVDWENFDPAWQNGEGEDIPRDQWRKAALSSENGREDIGVILERGYLDLVSHNCLYINGDFVFYDQEFYLKQLPAKAILMRTIDFIYWGTTDGDWKKGKGSTRLESVIPRAQLQERYQLNKYQGLWHAFSDYFIYNLVNGKALSEYNNAYRRNIDTVRLNRYRMDHSEREFGHFRDIFQGAKDRQIYLFGSGLYAKRFVDKFGFGYNILGILDNDSSKWGTEWCGLPVLSPEYLRSLIVDTYKVYICIKEWRPVLEQLERMGIQNYSVYEPGREEEQHAVLQEE